MRTMRRSTRESSCAWSPPSGIELFVNLAVVASAPLGTWPLTEDFTAPSLVAVFCAGFTLAQVAKQLAALPDVSRVNDLHVSSMSTTDTAMTADPVTPTGHRADSFRADLAIDLQHRLGIEHTTLQNEFEPDGRCALTREGVV